MKTVFSTASLLLLGISIVSFSAAESMYNPLKSTVAIYNDKNFEKQVTFNREKGISVVQFYKEDGKFSQHSLTQTSNRRAIEER